MMVALRFARRELRGGVRGLWIVLACLALGVAAIAAVGSLREGVEAGLASEGRRLLGGDLEVQGGAQPLPAALRDWLRARGATVSDIVQMRSMLIAANGERQLVELKAVDPAYPLVGTADVAERHAAGRLWRAQDGVPGLVAEPVVLDRLGIKPGALVRLGRSTFAVRGALLREPDRVAAFTILGPAGDDRHGEPGGDRAGAARQPAQLRSARHLAAGRQSRADAQPSCARRFRIRAGGSGSPPIPRRASAGSSTRPACS